MKNIKSAIFLTILTAFIFEKIQAKGICGKGKEWKNGACRKINDKKNTSLPQLTPGTRGNQLTYAPQTFDPSKKYTGDGLVGNYFASSKTATIHDPSGKNKVSYTFEQVQEEGIQAPADLELIGTYLARPNCSGTGVCSHAMRMINLYGKFFETATPGEINQGDAGNTSTRTP